MKIITQSSGLFLLLIIAPTLACDFPPSLWCSSLEIAKTCNVETQCKQYSYTPASPVNLALYFESECNACKTFIAEQLYKTWKELGSDILNITIVPYGNAKEKKWFGKWEYTCQHGQDECAGNLIETCAMYIMQNFSNYFPFIHCIEAQKWTAPADAAKTCAKNMKIDLAPITDCANGKLGNGLLHEMALKTAALNPPHMYVPWITFNGQHDGILENRALSDLLSVVCDMYKGPKPTACSKLYKTADRCYKNP
ncbi:gamma-interferon-inducible lysosomal thiol reductase-like [Mercenaria mercenaria]|uniref:gamma-interferon-inducible lysosomal thiol reductase-like n=1 Tax=Mercenaria mercenaria TaxID=6596 RepID=UPI00234E71B3|nr:gamma-interferon-inducible lysosomal thiol reductase-like [Mercenaria mercenaria]